MMVNGEEFIGRDMVFRFGLMELDMRENSRITKQMVEENFGMWTEMYMMDIGLMIKLKDKEFTNIP